jgi:hypothetical protein
MLGWKLSRSLNRIKPRIAPAGIFIASWGCRRIVFFAIFTQKYPYFSTGKFAKWEFGNTPIIV